MPVGDAVDAERPPDVLRRHLRGRVLAGVVHGDAGLLQHRQRVLALVERFDIEPFPDFSAK